MFSNHYTEEILSLKGAIITNVQSSSNSLSIFAEMKRYPHKCPICGKITDSIHDYRIQKIKDMSMLGKGFTIILRKRRYRCRECGKRFFEHISFLNHYQRMTTRLYSNIISKFADVQSATHIAHDSNCSLSTAIRLFDTVSYPKPRLTEVLAIDEFKGNSGGHKYQCILSDPREKKVLDILKSRKSEDLYEYFNSFDMKEREKVKYVVMDLSTLFHSVIKTCFPNAQIVADKFHVCRLANWALENIRKEVQKEFANTRRIYFKRSRWILLRRRRDLTDDEKIQLSNMLRVSERLRKAYILKEEFYEIFNSTGSKEMLDKLKSWQASVMEANLPKFNQFMETVAKWNKEIIAAFETGYSNGFIEGCNNRTKVLKRICYGMRNFARFRNRILYIANS